MEDSVLFESVHDCNTAEVSWRRLRRYSIFKLFQIGKIYPKYGKTFYGRHHLWKQKKKKKKQEAKIADSVLFESVHDCNTAEASWHRLKRYSIFKLFQIGKIYPKNGETFYGRHQPLNTIFESKEHGKRK